MAFLNEFGLDKLWQNIMAKLNNNVDKIYDHIDNNVDEIYDHIDKTQSNWNASENELGHILNRTHYKKITPVNVIFDGNIEGKEIKQLGSGDFTLVKITPEYIPSEKMIGTEITYILGNQEYTFTLDPSTAFNGSEEDPFTMVIWNQGGGHPLAMSFPRETMFGGSRFTTGTWFIYVPGQIYTKTISCLHTEAEEIVQINDEFIPPKDWNASKTEPGHILNRTHWIEKATVNEIFDGNVGDREIIQHMPGFGCYVKISPQYITDKELIGSNITIVEYENELSYTIEEGENIQNTITTLGCEGYSVTNKGDMMVLSFPQNAKVTLEQVVYEFTPGTWFLLLCEPQYGPFLYVKSLSCLQTGEIEIAHTIPEKFIPDTIARVEDIDWNNITNKPFGKNKIKITFDGNLEGKELCPVYNYFLVKVSNLTPSYETLSKISSFTVYDMYDNGNEEESFLDIYEEEIIPEGLYDFTDRSLPHVQYHNGMERFLVAYQTGKYGDSTITPGIYFMYDGGESDDGSVYAWYTKSLEFETVDQLFEEYIPYTIARINDIPQSDWNQNDTSALDFIKNKPEIATDEEIIDMLRNVDMLPSVADSDGAILTDENENILLW